MTPYEALKPIMDAGVDSRLGDSIFYARSGAALPGSPNPFGFLTREHPNPALRGLEGGKARWYMKIARGQAVLQGGQPSREDKVTALKLDMVLFRPAVDTMTSDGDYYIVELQNR